MKRVLGVFLGILTAIGGFVDIGDLVANAETGARFRMTSRGSSSSASSASSSTPR